MQSRLGCEGVDGFCRVRAERELLEDPRDKRSRFEPQVKEHDAENWPNKVLRARLEQQGAVKSLSAGAESSVAEEGGGSGNSKELQMEDILMPVDDDAPQNSMPSMVRPGCGCGVVLRGRVC